MHAEKIGTGTGVIQGTDNFSMESLRKKMIGKPYSGKPNVRFDEGELEIEHG